MSFFRKACLYTMNLNNFQENLFLFSRNFTICIGLQLASQSDSFQALGSCFCEKYMSTLVGKQSDTDIVTFCIPYYIFPFIAFYKLITIDSILIIKLYLIFTKNQKFWLCGVGETWLFFRFQKLWNILSQGRRV